MVIFPYNKHVYIFTFQLGMRREQINNQKNKEPSEISEEERSGSFIERGQVSIYHFETI